MRDWLAIPPNPSHVFHSGGSSPLGVAVTRSQQPHLVVANWGSHHLTILSLTDGHVVRTIGTGGSAQGQLNCPYGVSVDPQQGYLWVADHYNHRIQVFTEEGRIVRLFSCCPSPSSVAFLSNGDVVVASRDDKKLHVYSPDGAYRKSFGVFGLPYQMAYLEGADQLAVSDYYNNCVQIISAADSHVVRTLAADRPRGVVVTPDQYVIVVESGKHAMAVFSPQGERVHQWGGAGSRGTAPGQFNCPYYATLLQDGRVAIADYSNNRIQLF